MDEYLKQHGLGAVAIVISCIGTIFTFVRGWKSDRDANVLAKAKVESDVEVAQDKAHTDSVISRQKAAVEASTALNVQAIELLKSMAQTAISRSDQVQLQNNQIQTQNNNQQAQINELQKKHCDTEIKLTECEKQHDACQVQSREQDDRIKKLELIVRGAKIDPC